jgi:hypothetical protein
MTDRIRVTMAVDLFIDDEQAMREKAFATLRDAWDSEDEFPYSSASDVPLAQVVHSVLAAALSLDLPGGRRGRLEVDAGDKQSVETSEDDSGDDTRDEGDSDSERDADSADADADSDGDSDSGDDAGEADRPEEPGGADENRDRPEEP